MRNGCYQSFKDSFNWNTVQLVMIILVWHSSQGVHVFEQEQGKTCIHLN